MPSHVGASHIDKMYVGSQEVSAMYLGEEKVYPNTTEELKKINGTWTPFTNMLEKDGGV